MKSTLLTISVILFHFHTSYAQWTRVNVIPNQDIIALAMLGDTLIAASDTNFIYKSWDGGISWTTVTISSQPILLNTLITIGNTMYVGTFNDGIFSSNNGGAAWKHTGANLPAVSGIESHSGRIYASTLGDGVFIFDSISDDWVALNDSLPSYSFNVNTILSIHNELLIGAGANGTLYRLNQNANSWGEEFYYGILRPGLQIQKLMTDSNSIYAVNGSRIIRSDDDGLNWADDKIGSHNGYSRNIYVGTTDLYTVTNIIPEGAWIQKRNKSATIGSTWDKDEEFISTGYIYDVIETEGKVFLGKSDGLYTQQPTTGLNQNSSENIRVDLFPNPSGKAGFTISAAQPVHTFTITNSLGQIIMTEVRDEKQFMINLELDPGMYIIKLNTSGGFEILKKIIIH
ncbi:MAG: T9SS type A sorting domain-containing protein [Bacteroidia bacterium]